MKRSYRLILLGSLAAGALSASLATQAFAQSEGGLEEVVVTARKTNENLVVIPLSVSALSATDLQNRGISNYVNLQDYTPGFKFINQSVNRNDRGYSSFIMRGMNPGTPVSYSQGVSVFLDGAPIAGGVVSGLTDVERVEVIKGPQSAYFGRSTFSGAVNFITRAPGFYPKAQVSASYASYNTYEVQGELEGAVFRDILAARVAARLYETDGQYSNPNRLSGGGDLGAQKTYSFSGELLFKPTDNLSVRVFGKYWKDDDGPASTPFLYPSQYNCNATQPGFTVTGLQFVNGKNFICGDLPQFTNASLSINTQIPASIVNVLGARAPALIGGLYRKGDLAESADDLTGLGLKRTGYAVRTIVHYDLPAGFSLDANAAIDSNHWNFLVDTSAKDLTLTPNPNFGSTAVALNSVNAPGLLPYSASYAEGGNNDDDMSAELRITSPQEKRLKGMLGASYYQQHTVSGTVAYGNAGFAQVSAFQANNAHTPAIFGSVTYDILDNLDLSVEGRQQWDTITNIGYRLNTRFEKTYKSFSPRAILSYHPTSSSTIYASYSEGTRPGGFNGSFASLLPQYQAQVRAQSPVDLTVPEQKVKMSEVGLKARFLDNRAQILSAVYFGDWTGRTIPNKVFYTDVFGVLQNTLFNVAGGHTELYGVEVEGRFQVTPEFLLEGTFNYAGTNIKNTYCGDCALITGNPNPTGTSMTGYPTYSGSLAGTYQRPAFADYDGFLRLEYIYTGNIWIDEANTAGTGPANKVNIRAGVNNGRYRFEAFGTNITNEDTYIYGQRGSDGLPQAGSGLTNVPVNLISVSAPDKAMYGVKLTATFGGNPPPPPPPPPAPPAPPPPPPPPPPAVAYEAREFVVYFPFDQYVLTPEAQQVIAQAADYAKGGNATRVVVVGHADTSGSAAYNVRLSERRAKAAADALVGSGLAQTALAVDWKGESMPAVATGDGVKEPLNRRATININF